MSEFKVDIPETVYHNMALNFISEMGHDVNEIVSYIPESDDTDGEDIYVDELLKHYGKDLIERILNLLERKLAYYRDKENQRHQIKDHTGALHANIMANNIEDIQVTIQHDL